MKEKDIKNNKIENADDITENEAKVFKQLEDLHSENDDGAKFSVYKDKIVLNKTLQEQQKAYNKLYEKVDKSIENILENYVKDTKVFKLLLEQYTKRFIYYFLTVIFITFSISLYFYYRFNYNNDIYNQNINNIEIRLQKIQKYNVPWYIKVQKKLKPKLPDIISKKLYKIGQYLSNFKVIKKIKKDRTLKNV